MYRLASFTGPVLAWFLLASAPASVSAQFRSNMPVNKSRPAATVRPANTQKTTAGAAVQNPGDGPLVAPMPGNAGLGGLTNPLAGNNPFGPSGLNPFGAGGLSPFNQLQFAAGNYPYGINNAGYNAGPYGFNPYINGNPYAFNPLLYSNPGVPTGAYQNMYQANPYMNPYVNPNLMNPAANPLANPFFAAVLANSPGGTGLGGLNPLGMGIGTGMGFPGAYGPMNPGLPMFP